MNTTSRNFGRVALALVAVAAACFTTLSITSAGEAAQNKPKQIVLGDLDPKVDAKTVGAPFDPCQIGWASFPAEVRPEQQDKKPKLRAPAKDDVFATGCRYDNGGKDTVSTDPGGKPVVGKNFIALIVWAKPGEMKTAQADQPGSTPQQYGSKQGLIKPGINKSSNEPSCTAIIPLANGTAAISITNGRFPGDTCSVVKAVGEVIAGKTP